MTYTRTLLAVALFGATAGLAGPSLALPAASSDVAFGRDGTIAQVRSTRMEQRTMRGRNKARSSQAGNARNPKRPPSRQNQGGTAGGPRY